MKKRVKINCGYFKKLSLMLLPYMLINDNLEPLATGNSISVAAKKIDADKDNDVALLKMKENPFKGEVRPGISLYERLLTPLFGVACLSLRRPPEGAAIGISGYPLSSGVLVTNAGWMATSWASESSQVQSPETLGWSAPPQVKYFYLADAGSNPGNSGGPVYLVENGRVVGICVGSPTVEVVDQEGKHVPPVVIKERNAAAKQIQLRHRTGLTIVVPIHAVNTCNWNPPSAMASKLSSDRSLLIGVIYHGGTALSPPPKAFTSFWSDLLAGQIDRHVF